MNEEYRTLEFDILPLEDLGELEEDRGAGEGLVYGAAISLVVWIAGVALWQFPGLRLPAYKMTATLVTVVGVLLVSHKIATRLRREHPEARSVDWLRRNGL